MKPAATVITRWTERVQKREFVKTLDSIEQGLWKESCSEVYVAHIQGCQPLEKRVYDLQEKGLLKILKAKAPSYCPAHVHYALNLLLNKNYKMIGFLDDDAFLPEPIETLKFFLETVSGDTEAGAVGPMGSYRAWCAHQNNVEKYGLYRINKRPWTTAGAQFYSVKMLFDTEDHWQEFLPKSNFRYDALIFMISEIYGYPVFETHVPYRHEICHAQTGRETADEYLERRSRDLKRDFEILIEAMSPWPEYQHQLRLLEKSDLKNVHKRAEKLRKGEMG